MQHTTTEVEVLGRKIHELRGGQGRPLLYLHGALAEGIWLPHLTALAQRYELHVPAHPGFLGSEGIDEIRDVEDLVYHYLAYLDLMGWSSVDIVGLSLGGWIAAEIAARYPSRVSGLVLTDAVGIWVPETPIKDIFALDTRYPEQLPDMFFHDTSGPLAQALAQAPREMSDEMLTIFMNSFAATAKIGWNPLLHDPRLESLLPRVSARTLCLWGANDQIVPPVYAEKFAKLIPGAELRMIPECGHLPPLEKPEAFVQAVCEFIG